MNRILTQCLGLWGYLLGIGVTVFALFTNKTISGQSYLYPLLPLDVQNLKNRLIRRKM